MFASDGPATEFRHLTGTVVPVPEGTSIPEYHGSRCFGCGPENEHGLGLRFRLEGDRVVSELDFRPWFEGGPGVVHGGATAAFFDDLLGTVMMAHRRPSVTAKLETNYLKPIPLGVRIRGEGWLAEDLGNKVWVEAAGWGEHGAVYVESRALFIPIKMDHWAKALSEMTPEQRAVAARYQEDGYYP